MSQQIPISKKNRLSAHGEPMTIDEAIQLHGVDAVFTAASAGACEDFEPLKALGLHVDTIAEAEQISLTVYRSMTAAEKAVNYWEAAQDMNKNKEPVNWDDMDFKVGPRLSHESEAAFSCMADIHGTDKAEDKRNPALRLG